MDGRKKDACAHSLGPDVASLIFTGATIRLSIRCRQTLAYVRNAKSALRITHGSDTMATPVEDVSVYGSQMGSHPKSYFGVVF